MHRLSLSRFLLLLALLLVIVNASIVVVVLTKSSPQDGEDGAGGRTAGSAWNDLPWSGAAEPLGPLEEGPPRVGQPAPDFRVRDLEGRIIQLSALRGRVVVVNFWATWCGPCREEFPEFEKAYREQRDQGVVILAINVGEPAGKAASFQEQFGSTFPILLDPDSAVLRQYGMRGIPDSVFIDREGVVRDIVYGPLSKGTLIYKLNQTRRASGGSQ